MIRLQDVTLSYPDGQSRLRAVDGVGLDLPDATVTMVSGASGAGKSSLLAVAATLIRPDSGHVWIDDVDATALRAADLTRLRRERIGIVFQSSNLLASLTAVEQLVVMGELGGAARRSRSRRARRARDLLAEVGLADQADRRPEELSGGQRQRVNIARALMNAPTVLLVDEPTSALDSRAGQAVVRLIGSLTRERGTATMLITHDPSLVEHADRHVVMSDGRLADAPSRSDGPAAGTGIGAGARRARGCAPEHEG